MLLLLIPFVWVIAELYVIVQVGHLIGALYTVILLLASWPLGSWAIRSQGGAAWRRLASAIADGRPPGREVLDGGLILLGGMLLMAPGLISDALGLILIFPPTRALTRAVALRNLQSRLVVIAARSATRGRRPHDVDSTATEIHPPRLQP